MTIRSAAKAVILSGDKVLLNKCSDSDLLGEYYDLPGGGQHPLETMEDAVKRECLEETGYRVAVDKFLALGEEIYDDARLQALFPDYTHRIYHVFQCHIIDERQYEVTERDYSQVGSEWVNIEDIRSINIYPRPLRAALQTILETGIPQFLGTDFVRPTVQEGK